MKRISAIDVFFGKGVFSPFGRFGYSFFYRRGAENAKGFFLILFATLR
jgi:hypothetical protein